LIFQDTVVFGIIFAGFLTCGMRQTDMISHHKKIKETLMERLGVVNIFTAKIFFITL